VYLFPTPLGHYSRYKLADQSECNKILTKARSLMLRRAFLNDSIIIYRRRSLQKGIEREFGMILYA
jgi:hypothetical protein